jgi:hypothetical protein
MKRSGDGMLAEIHNKISHHLEDQLTGDFFGTLRYLPHSVGLFQILMQCMFREPYAIKNLLHSLDKEHTGALKYHFWPTYKEGEIDLIIESNKSVIGIEVKYRSGLSSDDNVDNSNDLEWKWSTNQLSRYQKILNHYFHKEFKALIFLAPITTAIPVYQNVLQRQLIIPDLYFGVLTWEDVLIALKNNNYSNLPYWQKAILCDLVELLKKKRFENFSGFEKVIPDNITSDQYYSYSRKFDYPQLLVTGGLFYEYQYIK